MKNIQKIFRILSQGKILFPTIIVLVLFAVGSGISVYTITRYVNVFYDKREKVKIAEWLNALDITLKEVADKSFGVAAIFAQDFRIVEAARLALSGDISSEADPKSSAAREELKKQFIPVMNGFKKISGYPLKLHLHLNNNKQVRSIWRFDQIDQNKTDDIGKFRQTLQAIQKDPAHKPILGVEVGRSGLVIRGVAPVLDQDGNYLTSIEAFSDYDTPINTFMKTHQEIKGFNVFLLKEYGDIVSNKKNEGKHLSIGDQFVSAFGEGNFNFLVEHLRAGLSDSFTESYGDDVAVFHPIKDYSSKTIGVLAMNIDASTVAQFRQNFGQLVIFLLLIIFIPLVFMLILAISFLLTKDIFETGGKLVQTNEEIEFMAIGFAQMGRELSDNAVKNKSAIADLRTTLWTIASQANLNAEKANSSSVLMGRVAGIIDEADQSMKFLHGSMKEIVQASEKTQKIVQEIDAIAFQTNLLALNAAVEAARAGDAGAGFAVVADEVRNLAGRSATAAKNTAELIEETVNKVGKGTQLVEKTESSFSLMVHNTKEVLRLAPEIADASEKQAIGIKEINIVTENMQKDGDKSTSNADHLSKTADKLSYFVEVNQEVVSELAQLIGIRRRVRHRCNDLPDIYGKINGSPCHILDLSLQGARIESNLDIRYKEVEFECEKGENAFIVSARIVWKHEREVGLHFIGDPGTQLTCLLKDIADKYR
jgi:methyl-accepting chemotaxis protein